MSNTGKDGACGAGGLRACGAGGLGACGAGGLGTSGAGAPWQIETNLMVLPVTLQLHHH